MQNKPRVGIDCRFWGIKHAGLGRYTRELVLEIVRQKSKEMDFVLFFQAGQWRADRAILSKCQIVEANIAHYSFKEQLFLQNIIDRENLDFIHFTHFNIPILLKTPFIATIHDLIKHFFKGKPVTTRSMPIYWLKYGGYRLVIDNAIKKSQAIISPSIFTKDQINVHYPKIDRGKISVIYEGVSKPFNQKLEFTKKELQLLLDKHNLDKPFFIYTGSAYPSKNIETLLRAFQIVGNKQEIKLVISCARSYFWDKLQLMVNQLDLNEKVILPGLISDEDLQILYAKSQAFIMPSLMEGFGLPALEAMASGALVISSDSSCLPEIYDKNAFYFNPSSFEELADRMKQVLKINSDKKSTIIKSGIAHTKQYTWEKAANQTINVYEKVLKTLVF